MTSTPELVWDDAALRRAIQLLGSQSPRVNDPRSTAAALRLVWDILQRRGAPTEIFQVPGTMPLAVVPGGPILVITHLDDPHPFAQDEESGPPTMSGDVVSAPGITRKAGVLAALGAFLSGGAVLERATLVIETDRHEGSNSFATWLDATDRTFSAALCEVADLPAPAPALFLAAAGVVAVRITLQDEGSNVERLFGGVQPDLGHQLIDALAALKSADAEVLVPGFYDGVITPDQDGLAALQTIAPDVGAWVTRGLPPSDDRLSATHLTLGSFLAPSIVVRDLRLDSAGPYLSRLASAIIEARIMPGQDATTIARSIADFIKGRVPTARVETVLTRPAARGGGFDAASLGGIAPVIPVTPGNSPAGLLEAAGIPTLGFSTVWRDPAAVAEHASLTSISQSSRLIEKLIERVSGQRNGDRSSR
ncbi:MAG: hypothetical protein WEC79_00600 [Thermomicrobiales bacterium]